MNSLRGRTAYLEILFPRSVLQISFENKVHSLVRSDDIGNFKDVSMNNESFFFSRFLYNVC